MTKQDKIGTRGLSHILPTCRHRLLPGRRQARLPASSTVGGRLTTSQQTRQACPVPAQSGAQIRVPSSWVLCRLFPLVGALRAQLCPSWEPPRQGRLRRRGVTGGGFTQRMDFHLRRRAGLQSPAGLRRHEQDPPSPGGRWAQTSRALQSSVGSPQGHHAARGARAPTNPCSQAAFNSGLLKHTWLQV